MRGYLVLPDEFGRALSVYDKYIIIRENLLGYSAESSPELIIPLSPSEKHYINLPNGLVETFEEAIKFLIELKKEFPEYSWKLEERVFYGESIDWKKKTIIK